MAFNTQERRDIFPSTSTFSDFCCYIFDALGYLPVAAKGYISKCRWTDLLIEFIYLVLILQTCELDLASTVSSYPGFGCRTGRAWTPARGCHSWWGAPPRCSPADSPGCRTLWRAHWAGWSPPVASHRRAAARRAALKSHWPCGR